MAISTSGTIQGIGELAGIGAPPPTPVATRNGTAGAASAAALAAPPTPSGPGATGSGALTGVASVTGTPGSGGSKRVVFPRRGFFTVWP